MPPEHLQLYLQEQIPCRQIQIRQLTGMLNVRLLKSRILSRTLTTKPDFPIPSTIVVYGTRATGKSLTIAKTLPALNIPHAIVRSRECITGRHLLETAVLAVKNEVEKDGTHAFNDIDGRCENLSALTVTLQRLLEHAKKFVLVFDGVDKQREAPSTLLPGIARLGEIVCYMLNSVSCIKYHLGSTT
jgi:origin recognition complex subunit 5